MFLKSSRALSSTRTYKRTIEGTAAVFVETLPTRFEFANQKSRRATERGEGTRRGQDRRETPREREAALVRRLIGVALKNRNCTSGQQVVALS